MKKQLVRPLLDYEKKILKTAKHKNFKQTVECLQKLALGGKYEIQLSFNTSDKKAVQQNFPIEIINNREQGLPFQIKVEKLLNIGGVLHKESYGLNKALTIIQDGKSFYTKKESVSNFKTEYPKKPQYLNGTLNNLKTFSESPKPSYTRIVIQTNDTEFTYPTEILEFKKNRLKFDYETWHLQKSLIGLPFPSTKGMFVNVEINGNKFDFYGIEPMNSMIIDSVNKIALDDFKKYSYIIRLCFAFLSGKFYKEEVVYALSNTENFETIDEYEYVLESPSIISKNQIVNPTFFFQTFKDRSEQEQKDLEKHHKMFDSNLFSSFCEKVLNHPELLRTIELIITAGNLSDSIQKGALYSVAIETLTEFLKDLNQEVFKPIQDKPTAKSFRKEQIALLETYKTKIDPKGFDILATKINNLNSPTNKDKLIKPFELYGITLNQDDLEVLDQRNAYLHGGIPIDSSWEAELEANALKLHNLLNLLILNFIGYKGHYINLSGWYLMQVNEVQDIFKNVDFEEIKRITEKVNSGNAKDLNIPDARKKIENYEKFLKSVQGTSNIIGIIE
ncbi:hypothetical protein ACFQO1_05300 [Jejudonia soesokkakensis]|uniref:ApeA N-terminal domain-containing protein n=1 Tax=Jejudonia soesokkakensis TaxID=1323432 RepID=A0ABW2MQT8_9FLAO